MKTLYQYSKREFEQILSTVNGAERQKLQGQYKFELEMVDREFEFPESYIYVNAKTNLDLVCPSHGIFTSKPDLILNAKYNGCKKCGLENRSKTRTKSNEIFISEAKKIHGDTYDYRFVIYKGDKIDVTLVCPVHGKFETRPGNHLQGKGCIKCGQIRTAELKMKGMGFYINKAKEIHDGFYDYSITNFSKVRDIAEIICPEHGVFKQSFSNHTNTNFPQGCPDCGKSRQILSKIKSQTQFLKEAKLVHGEAYDFSMSVYETAKTKLDVGCRKHGIFSITPDSLLRGSGCDDCAQEVRNFKMTKSQIDFISECEAVHGQHYDYSLVEYKNSKTKVKIICPYHGEFDQLPSSHLIGYGCNSCGGEASTLRNLMDNPNQRNRPRDLYFKCMEHAGNLFWKVGLVRTGFLRFNRNQLKKRGVREIREERITLTNYEACLTEFYMLSHYDKYRVNKYELLNVRKEGEAQPPFGGTECFSVDLLDVENISLTTMVSRAFEVEEELIERVTRNENGT